MGNTYTGSNSGKAGLEVTEVDGTPDVFGVGKIIVSNGTLTDDGGGTVTITTGGGGGGAVTSVGMGTTGLTPAAAATGVITVAGTLVVANGGTGATTLTDGGVLLGSGTGAITALGQPADGQLIIGSTGADPVLGVLSSAGSSIEFLFGAGIINMEVGATSVVAGIYTNTDLTVGADGRITAAASGGGGGVTLSGTTNNTITTVTGANALIGEANLLFDGTLLTVTGNAGFGVDATSTLGFYGETPVIQGTATAVAGFNPPTDPQNQATIIDIVTVLNEYEQYFTARGDFRYA